MIWADCYSTKWSLFFCQNVTKPSRQQLPVNEESVNALIEGHEIPFSVLALAANKYHCIHVVVARLTIFYNQDKDVIFGTAHSEPWVDAMAGCKSRTSQLAVAAYKKGLNELDQVVSRL